MCHPIFLAQPGFLLFCHFVLHDGLLHRLFKPIHMPSWWTWAWARNTIDWQVCSPGILWDNAVRKDGCSTVFGWSSYLFLKDVVCQVEFVVFVGRVPAWSNLGRSSTVDFRHNSVHHLNVSALAGIENGYALTCCCLDKGRSEMSPRCTFGGISLHADRLKPFRFK